ncbi:septum formation protein Maf [Ancylostoma caninum]|uniref:Septum formation protein Maf n=1 Tax=Ancylostoma caninum TaxID=29170 RepID=A0A368FLH7_ANCCA|nr:septum formation protein Maf [Ancylostoma caninum]
MSTSMAKDDRAPLTPAIVVLASQSPNRLKLMRQMGIHNPLVRISNFEENLPKTLPVREFVEQTALGKLRAVVEEMKKNKERYDVIIASDTVIYFDGEIVGKPANADDAFATLQRLRGREHLVYSGVALAYADGSEEVFSEETRVEFGDYPDRIIKQYVDSGEPLSRAGSYGIQEYGAVFVRGVHGCFSNVVGLPIHRVHSALVAKGIL